MSDQTQIPYLLRLLEDDSPVVHDAVQRELAAFGPGLETRLRELNPPPTEGQYALLEPAFARARRRELREAWPGWRAGEDDYARMERALDLLAAYQNGPCYPVRLPERLDSLSNEFAATCVAVDSLELARFLFEEKGLDGAREDYYHPRNANLVHVLESRRGLPISLACIYMLTGARMGLRIEGCNFPGHFMARTVLHDHAVLVDCFNHGRLLDERQAFTSAGFGEYYRPDGRMLVAGADLIVARVLRNLAHAYGERGMDDDRDLMVELLARTVTV